MGENGRRSDYDYGDAFHNLVPDSLHPNAEGCKQIVTPGILKALSGEIAAKPL